MTQPLSPSDEIVADWVTQWVLLSRMSPEVTIGEWMFGMSIILAVMARMTGVPADRIAAAAEKMAEMAEHLYEKTDEFLEPATIQ